MSYALRTYKKTVETIDSWVSCCKKLFVYVVMMTDKFRIRQWLNNANYHNPEVTVREIMDVVKHYSELSPRRETYMPNDGPQMNLVNLSGTIPVRYNGNVHNIPICIWLMNTHPENAPVCYVKPTFGMAIKVSIFVDENGKIRLPYLYSWAPHWCNLLGLIQVMVITFSEQLPVSTTPRDVNVPYLHTRGMDIAGSMEMMGDEYIKEPLLVGDEDKLIQQMDGHIQQKPTKMEKAVQTEDFPEEINYKPIFYRCTISLLVLTVFVPRLVIVILPMIIKMVDAEGTHHIWPVISHLKFVPPWILLFFIGRLFFYLMTNAKQPRSLREELLISSVVSTLFGFGMLFFLLSVRVYM